MMVGDFSQLEMRLMASETREPHLVEAFEKGQDVHAVTALRTLGPEIRKAVPELATASDEELLRLLVDKDPRVKTFRDHGKTLNFAIGYGASEYGIARLAGVSLDEARRMISGFRAAYPVLADSIRRTHQSVTVLQERTSPNGFRVMELARPKSALVRNKVGMVRCFALPMRLIQILMNLATAQDIARHLPLLGRPTSARIRYYDDDKTRDQVVRSQLRSAARKLQGYVHRQSFNFRIQSLGACYTKRLQRALVEDVSGSGIHRAADLPVLPGINVHDEIHLYAKGTTADFHEKARAFTDRLSSDLTVPIVFDFADVESWADKA